MKAKCIHITCTQSKTNGGLETKKNVNLKKIIGYRRMFSENWKIRNLGKNEFFPD